MRRLISLAAAAAGALLLGACATLGTYAASTTADEQAVYVAEASFTGLRALAVARVDQDGMSRSLAVRAADWLGRAYSALGAVRAAYIVGTAGAAQAQALAALAVIADAQAVVAARDLPAASPAPSVKAEGLAILAAAVTASPRLAELAEETRRVFASDDPAFIRARTAALAAANDIELGAAIAKLRAAGGA